MSTLGTTTIAATLPTMPKWSIPLFPIDISNLDIEELEIPQPYCVYPFSRIRPEYMIKQKDNVWDLFRTHGNFSLAAVSDIEKFVNKSEDLKASIYYFNDLGMVVDPIINVSPVTNHTFNNFFEAALKVIALFKNYNTVAIVGEYPMVFSVEDVFMLILLLAGQKSLVYFDHNAKITKDLYKEIIWNLLDFISNQNISSSLLDEVVLSLRTLRLSSTNCKTNVQILLKGSVT